MNASSLAKQLTIGELLKKATHRVPNKEAFVSEEYRLSYSQMFERASQLAGWLQAQGIKKDDKVGFILKNSMEMVELTFGVALSGGVSVPINFRLAPQELEYIINNSDTEVLVIDSEHIEVIRSIQEHIPKVKSILVVGNQYFSGDFIAYHSIFKEQLPNYTPCKNLNDEDPALIMYTSGTTGYPKGAVLSHKSLILNRIFLLWETGTPMYSNSLVVLPLFHTAGFANIIKNCLIFGKLIIQREFNPVNVLQTIEKEKINSMVLVPTMWRSITEVSNKDKFNLSSVIECFSGASICPLNIKKQVINLFKNAFFGESFGQTETSPATTSLTHEYSIKKPESVGRPILCLNVRIVDEQMNDVPVGEVGEIIYQGPIVMIEYYKDAKATNEAFKDGWFCSGDLVKSDEEGFIYVIDRKKDMVISGGENIYPAEIEKILNSHSSIYECAVIGVPDEKWGESIKAFIVLNPNSTLTSDEVINYCTKYLASYKKPRFVEFINELPRNASGKILKTKLRSYLKTR